MKKNSISNFILLAGIFFLTGCSHNAVLEPNSLQSYIGDTPIEPANVIACAASEEENPNDILVFLYPRDNAQDIKLYETSGINMDEEDYNNYVEVTSSLEPLFNGYLLKFTRNTPTEKWMIVTFTENGVIQISNPIRIKQQSAPTPYNNKITIDHSVSKMPKFSWDHVPETVIYFQTLTSTSTFDLLSGTYTEENCFQFYNTQNVVLNITTQAPPELIPGEHYEFMIMAVSADNWVHEILQLTFIAE